MTHTKIVDVGEASDAVSHVVTHFEPKGESPGDTPVGHLVTHCQPLDLRKREAPL